jgi:glycosyltransferase involved in cell wall biosynthesis
MRIAIVSDYYLDYVGGAQTSMLEQKASLEEAGHTVFMVSAARGLKRTERDEHGIRIKPSFTVPGVILPVIKARPALEADLKSFLSEEAIDVVHVQTEFGLAHAIINAAYLLEIPVVHTVHTFYWQSKGAFPIIVTPLMRLLLRNITRVPIGDTPFSERPSDSLLRNLTIAMAKRADVVVSPSAHQAKDLSAGGVERPIGIVPNPVSRATIPATELTPAQASAPRLLWVARVEVEKRPLVFIDAVLDALGSASFAVDIVGDGTELAALRAKAAGHPEITVHGALPHEQVIALMDASSVVALTSLGFDNQPMTIAEAVSRYRGVLFCDSKLREGLGDSGYLSSTPDTAGLAAAIVELVTDPSLLVRLSAGAKADSVTFSGAAYVEHILGIYERARVEAH